MVRNTLYMMVFVSTYYPENNDKTLKKGTL